MKPVGLYGAAPLRVSTIRMMRWAVEHDCDYPALARFVARHHRLPESLAELEAEPTVAPARA